MIALNRLVVPFAVGRFSRLWWLCVFLGLAVLYWLFLFFPSRDHLFGDWLAAEAAGQFLGEGLREGYFPWATDTVLQRTHLFWGVPEFPCFPFSLVFLLGPALGYFCLLLFCLALGVWFSRRLSLRLRLSPLSSLVPVAVTFLGGPFVSHYAIGHFMWQGLLLCPAVIWLVLDQGRFPAMVVALRFGLLALLLLCLGSLHVAVWFSVFFVVVALGAKRWRLAMWVVGFVVLFGAVRLFPAAYSYAWEDVNPWRPFAGFASLDTLVSSVVILRPAHFVAYPKGSVPMSPVNYWEYSMFASLSLSVLLVVAGVLCHRSGLLRRHILPLAVFTLASLSVVYLWVCYLPLPLATFQRIPSRFFATVLLFLFWLLAPALQLMARRCPGWFAFAVVLGIHDLIVHLSWYSTWHLGSVFPAQPASFPLPVEPPEGFVWVSLFAFVLSAVGVCAAALMLRLRRVDTSIDFT